MALSVSINGVTKISTGVFKSDISPSDINSLGNPLMKKPGKNILLIDNFDYQSSDSTISFEPKKLSILSLGTSNETIIINNFVDIKEDRPRIEVSSGSNTINSSGDNKLLMEIRHKLPRMAEIGEKLIKELRRHYSGHFERSDSGTFIHRIDNFIAIKIQPTDKSLRIFIRGNPEIFEELSSLEIKPDRNSYSRFKIEDSSQLEDAIKAIHLAKKKE